MSVSVAAWYGAGIPCNGILVGHQQVYFLFQSAAKIARHEILRMKLLIPLPENTHKETMPSEFRISYQIHHLHFFRPSGALVWR